MYWKDSQGLALVRLVSKDYDKYKANKANTTRKWAEKLSNDPDFNEQVTGIQVKNFVAAAIRDFHHAAEKKNSTGFGDVEEMNAHEILLDICKYWYYDVIYNLIVGTSSFQSWDNRR